MPVGFFDIKEQNKPLEKEINQAIEKVVASGRYILGQTVADFEQAFAKYCGTKHAVGVASGTDALQLGLIAAGVQPGDEVITSPFTFVASAEAIVYCGAKPVFVDIKADSFNLDISKVEQAITKKTKVIMPIHLYGLACEMGPLMELANKHKLAVVEDCAQAAGAEFNNKKVGSFGTAGAFSFFPTKNLGCFGDGGIITTNDDKIANELKVLRNHGSRSQYHHDLIGFNSRLDALQAAVLGVKLPHLDEYVAARRKNADNYHKNLSNLPGLTLPTEPPATKHTYNQFTLRAKNRNKLVEFLKSKNIGAMVYYPISLHLQKVFAYLGIKPGDLPQSELAQEQVVSLPIFPELSEKSQAEVIAAIKEFHKQS
ncbi:MAG: DegT/DnrJ/EryC1/StrS family aminotransferase [bacterium]